MGYAYDSHMSYLDHLRLRDAAREGGAVTGEASNRGARRVEAAIADAASQITGAVHELSSEVRAASEIMEWGFSAMLDEMAEMKTTLKELLRSVREPSQTWAYEQFEIARDNYRKGNYEDCLKRLEYAINGHQAHLGFPEEWRLHQLSGDIYLQCPDRDLIDLAKAEKCFLAAAKYAGNDDLYAKAMALTAAAVAAYNQGHMQDAETYARQGCQARHDLGDAHFQLARIMLNRRNYKEAWQAALQAIALDHRYAARVPIDSEFVRNAAQVNPLWRQYGKELRARVDAAVQNANAAMRELVQSREETDRLRNSRVFELMKSAGPGLAEAVARFQKMTELVNMVSPEAERSLKLATEGLQGNTVFAFLVAEVHAQRANDILFGALPASREAQLTIQKVDELSQQLAPTPKIFLPDAVTTGVGCVGAIVGLYAVVLIVMGVITIARWAFGSDLKNGIGEVMVGTVFGLLLLIGLIGIGYFFGWVFPISSKEEYRKVIEHFDWKAANSPQTTAASDAVILIATEAMRRSSIIRNEPHGDRGRGRSPLFSEMKEAEMGKWARTYLRKTRSEDEEEF